MKKYIYYFLILTSFSGFTFADDTGSPDKEIDIPTGNVSEEVEKESDNQMMMATLTGGGAIFAGTKAMSTCPGCAKTSCTQCYFYVALTAGLTAATIGLYENSEDNKKLSRDFRDEHIKCIMKGAAFQWDPATNFCKPKSELCEKDGGKWDFAANPPCQFPTEGCEEGEEKRGETCVPKDDCLLPGYEKNEEGICALKDTSLKPPCEAGYKLDEITGLCKKSSEDDSDGTLGGGGDCPKPLVPDKKQKEKCLPKLPNGMEWDGETEKISLPEHGISASANEMDEGPTKSFPFRTSPY